jgi:acyl dehydratase
MSVDDRLVKNLTEEVGVEHAELLGVISAGRIGRYAAAVDDSNPLYRDAEYARSLGYAHVVAPPNLIVAVINWTSGAAYDRLREDGTEADSHLPGVPASGVRVMGGGEEIEFVAPIVAGTEVSRTTVLLDINQRESKTGPLVVARYQDHYTDSSGAALVNSVRTVILR